MLSTTHLGRPRRSSGTEHKHFEATVGLSELSPYTGDVYRHLLSVSRPSQSLPINVPPLPFVVRSIYPQLFIAIIGYASVGTFVTTKLGGKLVGLNFDQLQTEADFR